VTSAVLVESGAELGAALELGELLAFLLAELLSESFVSRFEAFLGRRVTLSLVVPSTSI
jgi:hypothetical protein